MKKIRINKILSFALSMIMINGNGLTTFGSAGNETNQEEPNMLGIDIEQHMVGESEINGTAGNRIYKISSVEELLDLSIKVNKGEIGQETIIELENDITIPEGINWVPIGCEKYEFKGKFDGNNHKILGILCEEKRKDDVGLFGIVGKEGIVKNIIIENSKFEGNINVGGMCGTNKGTIINCNNKCIINGRANIGGNVGKNEGIVEEVNNLAGSSVVGYHVVGGNVGWNEGIVEKVNNLARSSVKGYWNIGGNVGWNKEGGRIKGSENRGNITGEGIGSQQIGGNIGWNKGTVEGVKNLVGSSVTGHHFIGGNVGRNEGTVEGANNLAGSSVTGNWAVGGNVGYNNEGGTVKGSENVGNITGEGEKNQQIGGNVGRNEGIVEGGNNLVGSFVIGNWAVGGNVGWNKEGGTVKESKNEGNITGKGEDNQQIGGNVGRNEGIVEEMKNLAGSFVTGNHVVGGNVGGNKEGGRIKGSENRGNITGEGENNHQIGGNVGCNRGTVEGVKNLTGSSVTGNKGIGGNVGINVGTVKGSENRGNIIGEGIDNQQIGGNVGRNEGIVEGVKNLAGSFVTGNWAIGGNVGCNEKGGTVKGSVNGGNIIGEGDDRQQIGGNVGRNEGIVEGVKNLAGSSVTGHYFIGGNVGGNGGIVKESENEGNITGEGEKNQQIGGNVGRNEGIVEGVKNLAGSSVTGHHFIGSNVGGNGGTVKESKNEGSIIRIGVVS